MPRPRRQRIAAFVGRSLLYASVLLIVLLVLAAGALQTGWGKNQLRRLILQQARQYLTVSLELDRLSGSIVSGLTLEGIRLSRDGRALITVDRVALAYRSSSNWRSVPALSPLDFWRRP